MQIQEDGACETVKALLIQDLIISLNRVGTRVLSPALVGNMGTDRPVSVGVLKSIFIIFHLKLLFHTDLVVKQGLAENYRSANKYRFLRNMMQQLLHYLAQTAISRNTVRTKWSTLDRFSQGDHRQFGKDEGPFGRAADQS